MSHYARLKVTQDAPVEVIRAAYRVLAAKYHPDRQAQGEAGAHHDGAHAEMAALNTAYQVLIHPETRRDYDALLAERKALRQSKTAVRAAVPDGAVGDVAIINNRVDMEWIPPKTAAEHRGAHLSRRVMFLGGSLTGVLVVGLTLWVWQMMTQSQMEQALSDQYAARPTATVPPEPAVMPVVMRMLPSDGAPSRLPALARVGAASEGQSSALASSDAAAVEPASAASKRMPSVTDLSKLSNEELAQLLPALRSGSLARNRRERHPLDGQPLNLRQDGQLVEVLPDDGPR